MGRGMMGESVDWGLGGGFAGVGGFRVFFCLFARMLLFYFALLLRLSFGKHSIIIDWGLWEKCC